jgi:hypothetical protein
VDVAVLTNEPEQIDYAFEIKTEKWTAKVLVHQIRDYLLAGYTPIVILPGDTSAKTLDAEARCSIEWILEFLSASVVAPVYSSGTTFELREDRLPVNDPLRDFFSGQK